MTQKIPEIKDPGTAVAQTRSFDELEAFQENGIMDIATAAVASGLFPDLENRGQAVMKIIAGGELGAKPFQSIQNIYFIPSKVKDKTGKWVQGPPKVHIGYKLLAGLVGRHPQYAYHVVEQDDAHCVLDWYDKSRGAESIGTSRFSVDDAQRAGLVKDGGNWKKWPGRMCFARAITAGVNTYCPAVLFGESVEVGTMTPEDELVSGSDAATPSLEAPKEVTWGPEGPPGPNWAEFWTLTKQEGFTQEEVHAAYGLGPEGGELKKLFVGHAAARNVSLEQVVGEQVQDIGARMQRFRASVQNAAYNSGEQKGVPVVEPLTVPASEDPEVEGVEPNPHDDASGPHTDLEGDAAAAAEGPAD
jgi:hypothetical protein